ncbi:MAG: DNA/RNA non-specific endonuclease [Pseudomonadota bacterium]
MIGPASTLTRLAVMSAFVIAATMGLTQTGPSPGTQPVPIAVEGRGAQVTLRQASWPSAQERRLDQSLRNQIDALSAPQQGGNGPHWQLRSRHFVFGMPALVDNRYDFIPPGQNASHPGISILVREGFVVGHFDRMKAPLWVARRWTRFDQARMSQTPSQDHRWREDLELPAYARGGTSYRGKETGLDLGHMARHNMNRAWGADSSDWGLTMSNAAPQHKNINRNGSAWRALEKRIVDIDLANRSQVQALWVLSGTLYRDQENPSGETPEEDFVDVARITPGGFGVPDATYKIIAWFDLDGHFHARAFAFEQPHILVPGEEGTENNELKLMFELGNTKADLESFAVSIDHIETRSGIDFFPLLQADLAEELEGVVRANL